MGETDQKLQEIAAIAGGPLPEDYVRYVRQYGFRSWEDGEPSRFDGGDISVLLIPDWIRNMEEYAEFPEGQQVLPVAGDYSGHGTLFLEIAPVAGQVWFRSDLDDPIVVADSFSAFIEGLHHREAPPEPPEPTYETLTGEIDPATGFAISDRLREIWKTYGTGDGETQDSLDDLAAHIGQPLPEAYRKFLLACGAVYFGGQVSFPLPLEAGATRDSLSSVYAPEYLLRQSVQDPMPFALGGLMDSEWLIGLTGAAKGQIFWREDTEKNPVRAAPDLYSFIAGLQLER